MPATKPAEPLPDESWKHPLKGEGAAWFERFVKYRDLGPARTVQALWDAEQQAKKGKKGALKPSGAWRRQIEKYRWEERILQYNAQLSLNHVEQFEDDFTRERINQHQILQSIQQLQMEVLSDNDEKRKEAMERLQALGDYAGVFKLGNTLYETMHGRPNDKNGFGDIPDPTEVRGPMLVFLPEHTRKTRLERAKEAKAEVIDVKSK